ncbi:hypothetical protein MPK71_gp264 [Erwinia phage pEa_SNUABM_1]|uniref:Uncharacterized protein n=1 Tax=Erwinia phage pEa_SNUABM_1 TaxID=2869543 RepID=A0AAE7XNI5_9CAUD|nr:hypothetical protein MPK71_gp264 [Erwinia phage pEa_SNUABM_1]QZE57473.1 hypothetical protein pEaSNUABM1_00264 [Erwinia phage pEa_SNUABM_1]
MTTYNISDLKTPESFVNAQFGHLEDLLEKLRNALGRDDLSLQLDADGENIQDVNTSPDALVGKSLIQILVTLHGSDVDEDDDGGQAVSSRDAWYAALGFPHVENEWGEWTNSFTMWVEAADGDMLEEISVENGNPKMIEQLVERINYWFPAV